MSASHRMIRAAEQARLRRTGELTHDVVVFARLLRHAGAGVAATASLSAVRALQCVSLDDRRDVRAALSTTMITSLQDRAVFDVVFDVFWSADDAEFADVAGGTESGRSEGSKAGQPDDVGGTSEQRAATRRPHDAMSVRRAVYSREAGHPGNVASATASEIDAVARRFARALGSAPGRRCTASARGHTIDMRASTRANLRFGDELLELRRTIRRRDRARIAVLCDVSSSMRPYTPLFLAFVHALTRLVRGVDAAVFNVDVVPVTDVFRRNDRRTALTWLGRQETALAGGTRIGHCLMRFLDQIEGSAVLRSDTIALILSDGWDVGEPELLQAGMRRLSKVTGTVVWCDPHAAATGYQPQVQGMRVARPYCDHYLDFGSAGSLTELVSAVTRKDRR